LKKEVVERIFEKHHRISCKEKETRVAFKKLKNNIPNLLNRKKEGVYN